MHMLSYLMHMIDNDSYGFLHVAYDSISDSYEFLRGSYEFMMDVYEFKRGS